MKKKFDSLYETFGGTYREKNGHLIPEIALPEQTNYQIGKYGHMRLDYIKQHRRGRYTALLTEGKLNARLHEIDLEANEMLDTIILRLAAERGINENLKARHMLRWVAEMHNIKSSAEALSKIAIALDTSSSRLLNESSTICMVLAHKDVVRSLEGYSSDEIDYIIQIINIINKLKNA